ncbi:MAG: hypothetical protein ACQETY_02950, partial [Pseudomonadota bacterium]
MLEWHPARRPKALSNAGTEAWQSPACTQKAAPVKTIQAFSCCGAIGPNSPEGKAGLGMRERICQACNTTHERNINTA